jgi:membrane fusion protein, copper/silver efflux system
MKKSAFLIFSLALIFACTTPKERETKLKPLKGDFDSEIKVFDNPSAAVQSQTLDILLKYLQIKDALIEENGSKVKELSDSMLNFLYSFDPELIIEGRQAYYNRKMAFITDNVSQMSKTTKVAEQRLIFISLSIQVYGLVKAYGLENMTVFQMFCSMADNNDGAFWLSASEEIENPYHGAKMLNCGEIKEVISPRSN